MLKEKNVYKVEVGLTALMGLTLILSLFCHVWNVSALGLTEGESGFKFLTFSTELSTINQALSICCSIVCLLQLLYGVCCLLVCLYYVLSPKSKNMSKILDKVNLGAFAFLMLFAIAGIIVKFYVANSLSQLSPDLSSGELAIAKSAIHTNAFIGLIIGCVLYAVYIMIKQLNKNGTFANFNQPVEKSTFAVTDVDTSITDLHKQNNCNVENSTYSPKENNEIDLLNKYFELFEKGVLTQDEFNEKKQSILKG